MNLREIIDLTINTAMEYIVDSDHESFFEEIVDSAVMGGLDRDELYGLNKELDKHLNLDEVDDEEDEDNGNY